MRQETRREMILSIALEMIAERGIAGLSTRELSRRAGVSEALIFHHFRTKVGLIVAAARSGDTLLSKLVALTKGPPPEDLGAVVDTVTAEAVRRMAPGAPGRAFGATMMSDDPKIADIRAEGLLLFAQARTALVDWMNQTPRPLRHGGTAAAQTLLEGVMWRLATLPNDAEGWARTAPDSFADLALRWRALHLED
ncbi:TetR/AcrR family transcriptional regulator [Jannaschia donghaensis]|uniref:Transcriptional regulator BetI n=1 Tax=Jannaschia donghaensis TaxID=420998 RepID=A0A0M6YKQ1_9RHOB|nr:TetR/AcrR family transcriptional regulator [Jannaschia donghaensis]CTQ50510.1 transcriptional regulator BetI [Jannaschia donghaensis]